MCNDVKRAEEVIENLMKGKSGENTDKLISSSQLRKIFSAVNNLKSKIVVEQIKNKFNDQKISEELQREVQFLKPMLRYQAGRNFEKNKDNNLVHEFIEEAQLIDRIDKIGDSLQEFNNFHKYLEALVAFHKYYSNIVDERNTSDNLDTSDKADTSNTLNEQKPQNKGGNKYDRKQNNKRGKR